MVKRTTTRAAKIAILLITVTIVTLMMQSTRTSAQNNAAPIIATPESATLSYMFPRGYFTRLEFSSTPATDTETADHLIDYRFVFTVPDTSTTDENDTVDVDAATALFVIKRVSNTFEFEAVARHNTETVQRPIRRRSPVLPPGQHVRPRPHRRLRTPTIHDHHLIRRLSPVAPSCHLLAIPRLAAQPRHIRLRRAKRKRPTSRHHPRRLRQQQDSTRRAAHPAYQPDPTYYRYPGQQLTLGPEPGPLATATAAQNTHGSDASKTTAPFQSQHGEPPAAKTADSSP